MILRAVTGAIFLITASGTAWAQSVRSINAAPPPPPPPVAITSAQPVPDMQAVLDAHRALQPKPIETLTPMNAIVVSVKSSCA